MVNDGTLLLNLYEELKHELAKLRELHYLSHAYCAQVELIEKGNEHAMRKGSLHLDVTHYFGQYATQVALSGIQQIERPDTTISGRFAARTPGFIIVDNEDIEEAQMLVTSINTLKDKVQCCVQDRPYEAKKAAGKQKHGRNHLQKHEFLHTHIPRANAYQLYRHVQLLDASEFRSLSFHWQNKNANVTLSAQEAESLVTDINAHKLTDSMVNTVRDAIRERAATHRFYIQRDRFDAINVSVYLGRDEGRPVTRSYNAAQPIMLYDVRDAIRHNQLKPHRALRTNINREPAELLCPTLMLMAKRK